jgi:hypothetical protein
MVLLREDPDELFRTFFLDSDRLVKYKEETVTKESKDQVDFLIESRGFHEKIEDFEAMIKAKQVIKILVEQVSPVLSVLVEPEVLDLIYTKKGFQRLFTSLQTIQEESENSEEEPEEFFARIVEDSQEDDNDDNADDCTEAMAKAQSLALKLALATYKYITFCVKNGGYSAVLDLGYKVIVADRKAKRRKKEEAEQAEKLRLQQKGTEIFNVMLTSLKKYLPAFNVNQAALAMKQAALMVTLSYTKALDGMCKYQNTTGSLEGLPSEFITPFQNLGASEFESSRADKAFKSRLTRRGFNQ